MLHATGRLTPKKSHIVFPEVYSAREPAPVKITSPIPTASSVLEKSSRLEYLLVEVMGAIQKKSLAEHGQ